MKVVINKCYGGFGLSLKAQSLYAQKKGFNLYFYKQIKYKFQDGLSEYTRVTDDTDEFFAHAIKKDLGEVINTLPNDEYFSDSDIKRDDPDLVLVVEELGDKASGNCANLKVVEIPDNTEYIIDEYDGMEHIAEKHETWG